MTVAELIADLKNLRQDLPVYTDNEGTLRFTKVRLADVHQWVSTSDSVHEDFMPEYHDHEEIKFKAIIID